MSSTQQSPKSKASTVVFGQDVPFAWTPGAGASLALPSVTLLANGFPGAPVDWSVVLRELRQFDAECRISEIDWAAHGLSQVPQVLMSALGGLWIEGARPVWVSSTEAITLGCPFVTTALDADAPDGATFHWVLGYAGLSPDSHSTIPGDRPPGRVLNRALKHLAQEPDEVQVTAYLSDPNALREAQYLWSAVRAEWNLAQTVSKRQHHVPYTGIARLLQGTRKDAAGTWYGSPYDVFALDVTTLDGPTVTPAVVVSGMGSGQNRNSATHVLVNAGFTEVTPLFGPGATGWYTTSTRTSKTVFVKDPTLFSTEDSRAWLGAQVDRCSRHAVSGAGVRRTTG